MKEIQREREREEKNETQREIEEKFRGNVGEEVDFMDFSGVEK